MTMDAKHNKSYVVLGAGPAGMGAAWELARKGAAHITVIDRNDRVGGLARTLDFKGYKFDVGPHRFMTKYKEVEELWKSLLGPELLERPRFTRIHYRGKFFLYPLNIIDALKNLGLVQSVLAGMSFMKAKITWMNREPANFAEWTSKAFGNRIAQAFFRTYLKKVWGIEAHEVGTDWAGQRIKKMGLFDFFRKKMREFLWQEKTEHIGDKFYYPKLGAGQLYETMRQKLEERGVRFILDSEIVAIAHRNNAIDSVTIVRKGLQEVITGDIFLSSIPTNYLIKELSPAAPLAILNKLDAMKFRAHIAVNMIIKRPSIFPDSWLYVQSPEVGIARIGNYNAFSPFMIADPATSAIGVEYYCFANDPLWNRNDEDMLRLAVRELVHLSFIEPQEFADGFVLRHRDAYPTYYLGYRDAFAHLRSYAETFTNLVLIGRAGMYKYKDQDHALYTGLLAVRNLFGEHNDVWALGEEQEHFEEQRAKAASR